MNSSYKVCLSVLQGEFLAAQFFLLHEARLRWMCAVEVKQQCFQLDETVNVALI